MEKSAFFQVLPVTDALHKLLAQALNPLPTEHIVTTSALGRVLAAAPQAPQDLPPFRRSAMDGYAVRASDTFGASQSLPAYLSVAGAVRMGEVPTLRLSTAQAAEIHTGAMLPEDADAVVMIERTQKISESEIEVLAPVASGENVIQIGEDVQAGAPILPAGHRLRPQDIGGLLAAGVLQVEVFAAPRVGLLSSGDELVPAEQTPTLGQIRDINAAALAALVSELGAAPNFFGIARDDRDDLYSKAQAALDASDVLILTAGSSVSVRDLTSETIQRLGAPGILQHGLAVKPGKPTLLAVCDGKLVIGLPGNPVSAFIVARQIVLPMLRHLLQMPPALPFALRATLAQNVASTSGRMDTIPVRLRREDDAWIAEPILGKSNLIFTLVQADGLLEIPLNSGGLKAGALVDIVAF